MRSCRLCLRLYSCAVLPALIAPFNHSTSWIIFSPIAIAKSLSAIAWGPQIMKSLAVTMSRGLSVCKDYHGRNFDSILMIFCTVIWGPKSNSMTPLLLFPNFYARELAHRVLAMVILSVCLSVTTRYQFKPRWDRVRLSCRWVSPLPRTRGRKRGYMN